MRVVVIAALCASVTAFALSKSSVIAPPKSSVIVPLIKALELRGGSVLSKEAFATTLAVSNGLFGLQFLLIPKFFFSQFFFKELDEYHMFLSRFIGVLVLGHCALLKLCPAEDTFCMAGGPHTQLAVAVVGPIYAQLNFETKPFHLFPVIAVCGTAALALLAL